MSDLNMMLRQHAISGLQTQLDAAVTNGDTEGARKIAADMAKLEASTAPAKPAYADPEIRAELNKLDWFGTDPKKSAKAMEFGKTLDPAKFATAALFAEAIVKAVEAEFPKPAAAGAADEPEEDEEEDEPEEPAAKPEKKPRKTDGPGEGDGGVRGGASAKRGPWTKLSDAPPAVQAEVKRQADKLLSSAATKEAKEKFITNALGVHYQTHLRSKGK